jgi:hypothetical protein
LSDPHGEKFASGLTAYRSEFELLVARRSMGQKPTLQIAARYVLSANADVRWRFA